jgi:LysM repeat protein/ABC-type branched-subunit amino acid transport system substrate-binding protein
MRKLLIIFFLLALAAPSVVLAQDGKKSNKTQVIDGKKYYMHTVEKGQTLYQISKIYGLDVNDIVLENPEAIDGIKPGQVIKVPLAKPSKQSDKPAEMDTIKYLYHKVDPGQTVYAISRTYAITVETIESLNPGAKAGLKAGQLVRLPKNPATQEIYKQQHPTQPVRPIMSGSKTESGQAIQVMDSASALREVYNVAFFLPFHLDEIDLIDVDKIAKGDKKFPQKAEVAIEFYQGVRIALDSLRKKGKKINAYFYDIDDRDSANLGTVLAKPEFKDMHLIVGPLYTSNFVRVAKFANEKKIPIVSPLSQQNKILFRNPYVSKVTPAVTTQMEQMGEYIANKYCDQNIILLSGKDTVYRNPVRKRVTEVLASKNLTPADTLKEVKSVAGVQQALSATKANIVIIPSNARVYVTDVLSKLNTMADKHNVIVFGMPSWNTFDNLDLNYVSNVHFHYVTSSFIDYDNDTIKQFLISYRALYHADPSTYVFQGYDVTNYYMGAMLKYGVNFQARLSEIKAGGLQTSFDFINVSADSGYENKAIRIIGCTDYKQSRVE